MRACRVGISVARWIGAMPSEPASKRETMRCTTSIVPRPHGERYSMPCAAKAIAVTIRLTTVPAASTTATTAKFARDRRLRSAKEARIKAPGTMGARKSVVGRISRPAVNAPHRVTNVAGVTTPLRRMRIVAPNMTAKQENQMASVCRPWFTSRKAGIR